MSLIGKENRKIRDILAVLSVCVCECVFKYALHGPWFIDRLKSVGEIWSDNYRQTTRTRRDYAEMHINESLARVCVCVCDKETPLTTWH